MRTWLRRLLAVAGILLVAGMVSVRLSAHDADRWHVDPLTAGRTGAPNDCLAAPPGVTAAAPDLVLQPTDRSPGELMAAFDAVARAAPRVQIVAGGVEEGHVTYVQRSALFGFPDYVSVKAVETAGGASLAVWSRARYGYGDMGVNRARVESWLAEAGLF